MNRHKSYGMNIGSSSILLIFIVLCLVSFAALSLSSAVADQKLTEKSADKTASYYQACSVAEQKLATIDANLASLYANSHSEDEYFAGTEKNISFDVNVSDSQILQVSIEVLYPSSDGEPFYRITGWQEVTEENTMDYNETLTLPTFE